MEPLFGTHTCRRLPIGFGVEYLLLILWGA
jgi:hypothetical protein